MSVHASTELDDGYGSQFAGLYDRMFPKGEFAQPTIDGLSALHPRPGTGALEFGVGTGRIALPLSRVVGDIDGVDVSDDMLTILRAESRPGSSVRPILADMRTYETDHTYDLVYCVCFTLSLLLTDDDVESAVRGMARTVAPGGRLVLELPDRAGIVALHEGRSRASFFTPYPEPGTGLQTYGWLVDEDRIWSCNYIWHEADGTSRLASDISRLYTPDELDELVQACGLTRTGCYGDWDLREYSPGVASFIAVYENR